jgi:hypothetical protein
LAIADVEEEDDDDDVIAKARAQAAKRKAAAREAATSKSGGRHMTLSCTNTPKFVYFQSQIEMKRGGTETAKARHNI